MSILPAFCLTVVCLPPPRWPGPSGAGKSSLLNILAGRTRSGGKITVGGTVTANHVPVDPVRFRKRIAYVLSPPRGVAFMLRPSCLCAYHASHHRCVLVPAM